MNFGSAPIGGLVGLAIPRSQRLPFLFLKDLQRLLSGGAMDPPSGDIPTPAGRLIPEVGQVPELPSLEEALPHVLDAPLDVGLVPGVTHPCRIGDEAPVLGVFKEATGQPGVQRVGAGHRGGEVVDNQVPGDASEELPGPFKAGDHLLQSLAACGPDEAVPGVGQHHNQGPHRVTATTLWVVDEP